MLSGMKTLGDMAYSAAKSRIVGTSADDQDFDTNPAELATSSHLDTVRGALNTFFSRSAPNTRHRHERRLSTPTHSNVVTPTSGDFVQQVRAALPLHRSDTGTSSAGHYVTVIDLESLGDSPTSASKVAEFIASSKVIAHLQFTSDGNSLVVSDKDGHSSRLYALKPVYKRRNVSIDHIHCDPPWHIYDLPRGVTTAVIDSVTTASDGRWLAIGTRRRTVHVYATNPYGGKSDDRSHLEAQVLNPDEPV